MTTGVQTLGPRLADAGVDLLYFVDPLQDGVDLQWARDELAPRMALVGGVNTLTLGAGEAGRIGEQARRALEVLAPSGRLILHPVDALFPDTPWSGVQALIETWKEYC